MLLSKTDLGHWKYFGPLPKDADDETYFGFVYVIENKATKQFYCGKKQFRVRGAKRSKNYNKSHSWRTYTGSSTHLNADIKAQGKENFDFTMVSLYKTKGGLYYSEAYSQMVLGVMTHYKPCGKIPVWYNGQIGPVRFAPKEDISENNLKFIRSFIRNKRWQE